MSGRAPDDPHTRRLQNRVSQLENRIDYLEDTVQTLAQYIQAVERDTIAEPELEDDVADRVAQLVGEDTGAPGEENLMDDDDRLFD